MGENNLELSIRIFGHHGLELAEYVAEVGRKLNFPSGVHNALPCLYGFPLPYKGFLSLEPFHSNPFGDVKIAYGGGNEVIATYEYMIGEQVLLTSCLLEVRPAPRERHTDPLLKLVQQLRKRGQVDPRQTVRSLSRLLQPARLGAIVQNLSQEVPGYDPPPSYEEVLREDQRRGADLSVESCPLPSE